MIHIGVLASGRGSNLEALLHNQNDGCFSSAKIVCVVSDVPGARALEIAREQGLKAYQLMPRSFPTKHDYETEMIRLLTENDVSLVCLAGYMRLVGPTLLQHFENRMLNIHPSLLPSFPGLHAQRQAVEYGVRVSGCTVHIVDSGMDTGPIIAQRAVPLLAGDTEDTLSARILEQEHLLYAEAVKLVTEKQWQLSGRCIVFDS